MNDHQVVDALLRYLPVETTEFFYGQTYPVYKHLYDCYFTDCSDIIEFIHEIYLDVMQIRPVSKTSKLQTFQHTCSLKNFVGVIAIRYCYARYKRRIPIEKEDDGDRKGGKSTSILLEMKLLDREDVERLLCMMPNERYRKIIKLRYLEDHTNEETASLLGMSMDNFYNKHRLAKVQYLAVYRKEMGL